VVFGGIMPVGRIILKSISESKKLSLLKTDGARLLYTWLITHLDINGCFSGDAEVINGKVFTRLGKTKKTVEEYLIDLQNNKLVVRYERNGDQFLHVPDFKEKQPSLREEREGKPSIPLPTPDELLSISAEDPAQYKLSKDKLSKGKDKEKEKKDNALVEQAQRLFTYWKEVMGKPKAQFTNGRKIKIIARLKEGYSEDDCAKAIENVSIDPWYSGDNDRNKEYNDIALIFRDGEHLEKYRDMKPQIKRADGFDGARLWLEIKEEQDGQKRQGKIHGTDAQDEGQPALPDKT
jgi:hypothetical protein